MHPVKHLIPLTIQGVVFLQPPEESQIPRGVYWKEREYTLKLDNNSSQILWDGLSKGLTIMSFFLCLFLKGCKVPVCGYYLRNKWSHP